jgi:uncharacterized protein
LRARHVLMTFGFLMLSFGLYAQDEAADTSSALLDAIHGDQTKDQIKEVTRLLDQGADPNAKTEGGMPVLTYASMKGNAAVVAALVNAKADLEAKDKTGATALSYAAQFNHNDIVKALLDAGASVNAADSLGWTPLIRAAVGGNADGVKLLLAAGADKEAKDFFGRTALQVAQGRDHKDVTEALSGG